MLAAAVHISRNPARPRHLLQMIQKVPVESRRCSMDLPSALRGRSRATSQMLGTRWIGRAGSAIVPTSITCAPGRMWISRSTVANPIMATVTRAPPRGRAPLRTKAPDMSAITPTRATGTWTWAWPSGRCDAESTTRPRISIETGGGSCNAHVMSGVLQRKIRQQRTMPGLWTFIARQASRMYGLAEACYVTTLVSPVSGLIRLLHDDAHGVTRARRPVGDDDVCARLDLPPRALHALAIDRPGDGCRRPRSDERNRDVARVHIRRPLVTIAVERRQDAMHVRVRCDDVGGEHRVAPFVIRRPLCVLGRQCDATADLPGIHLLRLGPRREPFDHRWAVRCRAHAGQDAHEC